MLVLMGEDDYLFLPSAKKFSVNKSHSKLILISEAGHICNIDKPKETNRAILTFLDAPKAQAQRPMSKAMSGTNLL